jgi:hypothetical protein
LPKSSGDDLIALAYVMERLPIRKVQNKAFDPRNILLVVAPQRTDALYAKSQFAILIRDNIMRSKIRASP